MHALADRTPTVRVTLAFSVAALAMALASPALAQTTVKCESKDGARVSCPADTSQGVVLSKQLSSDGCWKDETWGTDAKGVWVSDHCAAEFTVAGGAKKSSSTQASTPKEEDKGGGMKKLIIGGAATAAVVTAIAVSGDDNDDDDNDRGYSYDGDGDIVRCESTKDRRTTCAIGDNTRVELVRQLSEADCRKGDTWGTNSNSIWVDNGCRGDFRVRYNDRNDRIERNNRNDEARARAKDKVRKEGGL